MELQRPAVVLYELHGGSGVRGIAGASDDPEGGSEPGATGGRGLRLQREPSVRAGFTGATNDRSGSEQGDAGLQRTAREIPAAVRQQFLVPELLHVRESHRPELGQRWHRDADERLRSAVPTADPPTTTSRTRSRRAGFTSCRGRARSCMVAGSSAASCCCGAVCR